MSFPYRTPSALGWLIALCGALLVVGGSWAAWVNDDGKYVYGVHLSATLTKVIAAVCVAFFLWVTFVGLKAALGNASDGELVINAEGVSLKREDSQGKPQFIAFSNIAFTRLRQGLSSECLEIHALEGNGLEIYASFLPSKQAFDRVLLAVDAGEKATYS